MKSLGDKEGINKEIEKLEKQRITIQQKLTDNKEILDKYQAAETELAKLKGQNQLQQTELETLRKLQKADFWCKIPCYLYWD